MDDESELEELRQENMRLREEGHGWCIFDDETDATIPTGHDCGGCSCHLMAPCRHCLAHLPGDESVFINQMTSVLGRRTRDSAAVKGRLILRALAEGSR